MTEKEHIESLLEELCTSWSEDWTENNKAAARHLAAVNAIINMVEHPAAGPWRTDVENAPGDNTPLLYQVWDDSLSLKSFIVSTKYLIQFRKITPLAWAEINTEVSK